MKSLLLLIVAFGCAGLVAVQAQQVEVSRFPITSVNPAIETYPGGRGPDQLIIYTPACGRLRTGTNSWGAEAVVEREYVTESDGNDRTIPGNGFVVSGHGTAARWVQSLDVGVRIVVREDTCIAVADTSSLGRYAGYLTAQLRLRGADPALVGSEADKYRGGRLTGISVWKTWTAAVRRVYDKAVAGLIPLRTDELRGVWHRPRERSKNEIDAVVRRLAAANFNTIFLESFWGGKTIYPSSLADRRAEFNSFDVLAAYCEAGKRCGIQIHAWVHTFFLGYLSPDGTQFEQSRELSAHPEWTLVHRNGSRQSRTESGYIWACPANPAVQHYVQGVYREILTQYDVAGIQHDYIRFPASDSLSESSCFCGYCIEHVRKDLGIDLLTLEPSDAAGWGKWSRWKEERVNAFVHRIRAEFPGRWISAAVFPDLQQARNTKMQNWAEWITRRDVSFLCPMAYTSSLEEVRSGLKEMRKFSSDFPLAPGLAPFLFLRVNQLLDQMAITRQFRCQGVVFFDYTTMSDEFLEALKIGPFRKPSKPVF